jgi:hypothetical protein
VRQVRTIWQWLLVIVILAPVSMAQDWTFWQGPPGGTRIRARLRDKDANAKIHKAAVEVEVENIWLHAPSPFPQPIEAGVLRYEVDHCPPILTTDTRLSFDQLSAGDHTITIVVVGAENQPITPSVKLEVTIPQ